MIKTARQIHMPQRAAGATAYIALVALAVAQLGLALHHDQHSATELTNSCTACVQLEQFDDVVTTTATLFAVEPEISVALPPVNSGLASRQLRSYYGRAPPVHA